MTDPLSTIRQDTEALYQIKKYGTANTPPHALRQSILAACAALEAERQRMENDLSILAGAYEILEAERLTLKTAIDEAEYALHPNQGEPADPVRASQILRSTWPKDHPSYTARVVKFEPTSIRAMIDGESI